MPTTRRPLARPIFSLLLLPLLVGLCAVPACKKKGGAGDGKGGGMAAGGAGTSGGFVADPAAAAKAWVPAPRDGSRFAVDGAPKRYDKETIFELLNGGADALLEMGLTSLLHVRVKDGAQVFTDFEIQISDVSSPAKARAMLLKEKAPEAKAVKLGDEAYAEKGAVLFAKGRHLVRVAALPSGTRKSAPVGEIARQVLATPGAVW